MRLASKKWPLLVAAAGVGALCVQAGHADEAPKPAERAAAEETVRLPGVVITAPTRLPGVALPPSSVPASVQVIPGEDLRQSGTATLQDALTRLPGVTVKDEQGNSAQPDISLRGFEVSPVTGLPQGISVFLDGVRINEPGAEEVNFDLIPMEDIERIEVIRGPSAIFGRNTLAAAINIMTRRGAPGKAIEIVPELDGGSFGRQKYRLSLGGTDGPFDYYVAGTLFREDGWRDSSAGRLGRAFGKLGYKHDGTDLTLSFQYTANRIGQAGSLPLSELRLGKRQENFTPGDFFKPELNFGILNLRQELGGGLALGLNGFGRQLDSEQFNVNLIAQNSRTFNHTMSAGGTLQLTHDATLADGRQNHAILGIDYVHHNLSNTVFAEQNGNTFPVCAAAAVAAGQDPAQACPLKTLSTRVVDTQDSVGPYLQDTFELARRLFLPQDSVVVTGAVRWDWLRHDIVDKSPPGPGPSPTGTSTFSRLDPRIGFNYNLSPDSGFYFSYAQGFRAPAFLELTCSSAAAACPGLQAGTAPDPALRAVKATSYEVGVRTKPAPWLEGELSLFRTDVADDIFSVSPAGTTAVFFENIGNTRRQGAELALRVTGGGRVDAYVNYTFTDATFQSDTMLFTSRLTPGCTALPCREFVRAGNTIPLVPHHRLNAGVDYRLWRWLTVSLGVAYVGTQYFRGDEANVEAPLKDYVVLNGALRARWKELTASIWINNLLDNTYETFGTFGVNAKRPGAPIEPFLTPAPPINVLAGLSYRF